MSAVTLDDLRADLEAAYCEIAGPTPLGLSPEYVLSELDCTICPNQDWLRWERRVRKLAYLFIIARDQGLNAAMLWKLSQP